MSNAHKKSSPYPAWLGLALIAAVLIAAPFLVQASLGTYWVRILDLTLLYIMLALGLNIVVGYAGLLDLGYVAFYAVGAYLYALLASPQFGLHLPFWLLLPLGALMAGVFGALLGAPTLRLRGDYLAIVTLGFGEIIRIFITNLDRPLNITNGPQGINLIDPIMLGSFSFAKPPWGLTSTQAYYFLFLAVMWANRRMFWKVRAKPRPATACGFKPLSKWPSKRTSPALGVYKPFKQLNSVVLPAPLGPIRPKISPC